MKGAAIWIKSPQLFSRVKSSSFAVLDWPKALVRLWVRQYVLRKTPVEARDQFDQS
jgi:hypothetical protein